MGSIRGLYRMQDRPNEYALEYKLGSEDERQFLVFTTTDFSNTFSEKLIELKGNLEIGTLHLDDLKSKTKVKKRTKSFDRISSSHRSSINITGKYDLIHYYIHYLYNIENHL